MSRLIRYLRGSVRFRLTGAAPEQCLNALAAARLEFWDIEREDALNLSLCVPAREAERLQRLALRCLCTAEVTEHSGLRAQFGGLLRRPVLLLGLLDGLLRLLPLRGLLGLLLFCSAIGAEFHGFRDFFAAVVTIHVPLSFVF